MTLKTKFYIFLYQIAFKFFPFVVYTRLPFPRYPYMYTPKQLHMLVDLLFSINGEGSVVEVGCDQGWTTCYLAAAMREAAMDRPYFCIDSFSGFLKADYDFEYSKRNKKGANYENYFKINNKKWFDHSIQRTGYNNIRSFKADASAFDYSSFAPIAFCLLDIDIYLPIKKSLPRIYPHIRKGGIIVVDDCKHNEIWDGAYQAYIEFCDEIGIEPKIVLDKLGIIVKT